MPTLHRRRHGQPSQIRPDRTDLSDPPGRGRHSQRGPIWSQQVIHHRTPRHAAHDRGRHRQIRVVPTTRRSEPHGDQLRQDPSSRAPARNPTEIACHRASIMPANVEPRLTIPMTTPAKRVLRVATRHEAALATTHGEPGRLATVRSPVSASLVYALVPSGLDRSPARPKATSAATGRQGPVRSPTPSPSADRQFRGIEHPTSQGPLRVRRPHRTLQGPKQRSSGIR